MPTKLPLGEQVDFKPAARPGRDVLRGEHVLLRALDADDLYASSHPPTGDPASWTDS